MMIPGCTQFEESYFDKYYQDYVLQNPLKKLRFYRLLVEQVAPENRPPYILDLGCAFGNFLDSLNVDWPRFGLDTSEFAISRAQKQIKSVKFAASDISTIPFEQSFDIIVSFDVLEHVENLGKVAATIRSKLLSGGHVIFVVPVYDGPTGRVIRILDKDITHIHKKSRYFWLEWAQNSWTVEKWLGIYRYLFPWGVYFHLPTKLFRRFTPAVAVICRNQASE